MSKRTLGTLAAMVVALLSCAGPAAALEVPDHPLAGAITGAKIGPFEQFKDACGVAVDGKGDVYVADYYQDRVVVFDKKAEYLTKIAGIDPLDAGGVAPVNGPCDLAVDSAGRLYVAGYHGAVRRFAPAAYPPQENTSYGAPTTVDAGPATGIALDPASGDLYVDKRTYVAVYGPSGAEVLRIGEGSLQDSYGVAFSSYPGTEGFLYAGDAATEAVKVYDPSIGLQVPQGEISGEGTQAGRFDLADADLAVDPADGHVYVANDLEPGFEEKPEMVVEEFSAAGLYRGPVPASFALGSPSFLQAAEPSALAIAGGNLYVTSGNYEDSAVYIFGPPAPAITHVLDVQKTGTGEGTITSVPAGIGCGAACEGEFDQGETVVLKASAAPGSALLSWSGCDEEPSPGRCAVAMGADREASAEFEALPEGAALGAAAAAPSVPPISSAPGAPAPLRPHSHRRHRHRRHAHPRHGARR